MTRRCMHTCFTCFRVTSFIKRRINSCMPCLLLLVYSIISSMKLTGGTVMKSWAVATCRLDFERSKIGSRWWTREDLLLVRYILGHSYIVVVLLWGSFRRNAFNRRSKIGKDDVAVWFGFETAGTGSLGRRREGAQRDGGERERWARQVEELSRGWVFGGLVLIFLLVIFFFFFR